MTAAARRLRATVRGIAVLVALVLGFVIVEYSAQHSLVGLLLAAALVVVYVVIARRQRP